MLCLCRLPIGIYPTPVQHLEAVSRPGTSVWVKRDDQSNPRYGGNKIRKIERILQEAQRRGSRRIVTVGAVGSNYVLALGVFARELGIEVEAVLVPQPDTEHVRENLRADVAQGILLTAARSYAHAAMLVASRLGSDSYFAPPGGSNRAGVAAFVEAAKELAEQIELGEMPEPDLIVVALGSGGTAGGLAAGAAAAGLRSRVLAVTVAQPAWLAEWQARSFAKDLGHGLKRSPLEHLEIDRRYLGSGYGRPTREAETANEVAAKLGLTLDGTYTAKAFAAVLQRVSEGRDRTILYWHTLSSAPMAPLLVGAPPLEGIEPRLAALLRESISTR
jgi:1-aminocyclopropane-1-carboxylate deaminase/D-cysteine desulfhydrase-like pyridoxal-dependent ACC family enzyme